MDHVGMDLGKKESQIAIITRARELIEKRLRTLRERLREYFEDRPKAKILIESSTISEWVARLLEGLGHEVIVADPNYAPMYAQRSRRVKTDRRDALALAEACKLGAYRPAHRASDEQRHVRGLVTAREALVRSRARLVTLVQALLSRDGVRVPSGSSRCFAARVETLEVPELLQGEIAPLLAMLGPLNEQIRALDSDIDARARGDERVRRLMSVPEVGALTAVTFVATLDEVGRFRGAHQVEAYLGLVPREWSSSELQRRGHITKAGNSRMRWLLVEAASRLMWPRNTRAQALREWAERIASRRGRKVAKVALARRLTGILYALWRDGTVFDPGRLQRAKTRAA